MIQKHHLFDVFETLLVRRVGEPSSVFLLLGNRMSRMHLMSLTPERFAREREHAYRRARRRMMPRDTCLAAIYRELADANDWSAEEEARALAMELQLESELLQPWIPGVKKLARARRDGGQICFVSDTPLPEEFVREQLNIHDLLQNSDRLFVSSNNGLTKLSGALFSEVLGELRNEHGDVIHTGNSRSADVASAHRAGIKTQPLYSGNLNRYEAAMEEHRFATNGLSSAFAGASRLARAESPDDALVRISAGVAGPIITGYVLWLLRRAEAHDIGRLFFLSREGQFLHQVASVIAPRMGKAFDLIYLHGSRLSLNLAALRSTDPRDLAWVLTHSHTDSIRNQLRRVGLSPESCRLQLEAIDLPSETWDTIPTTAQHDRLVEALGNSEMARMVTAAAVSARERTLPYLQDRGFLDPQPVGIIDSAGIGSQFRSLSSLRSATGLERTHGFLFARTSSLESDGELSDHGLVSFEGYLEDPVRGLGVGSLPGMTILLEHFLAADHGMVLDFEFGENGSVHPVLAEAPDPARLAELGTCRLAIDQFLRHLVLDEQLLDSGADVRNLSRQLLTELWVNPYRDEAEALRRLGFEDGTGPSSSHEICRPIPLMELVGYLFRYRQGLQPSYHWKSGSLAVSGRSVRITYRTLRRLRHGLQRLQRKLGVFGK